VEPLLALKRWQGAIPGPPEPWYWLTALGAGLFYFAFAYFLALAQGRGELGFALSLGWGAVKTLKASFSFPRPFDLDPAVAYPPALAGASDASFPSGHAAMAALFAFYLARGGPPWGYALAAVWTLLVGLSRIKLGVHYPADVLAGWGLGLFFAFALPKRPPRPELCPLALAAGAALPLLAAPGGLAAAFTLLRRPLGAKRALLGTALLFLTLALAPKEPALLLLYSFLAPVLVALVVGWGRWSPSPTSTTSKATR